MNEFIADWFTLIGQVMTLIGAGVAAKGVILKRDDAGHLAVSRFASGDPSRWAELPLAKSLLRSSALAKWGLIFVAAGTAMQAVPVVFRLFC
ncbi:hypothetical protein [Thioclava sp. F36-7]|uniref:hypothetical protein n=1 Tax=Thioclava sp. F36-7 TaxID=1915317 RepID=UPI0009960362|nr:hypothetical protein [Thioclava sp. F36-7]